MKRCIDTERLCKDILLETFEDTHKILRVIENQPTADVVSEIIELLKELKNDYYRYDNAQSACAIRYAISLIEEKYTEEGK